jgi:hypothetical protein
MAIVYEKAVTEDLDFGFGEVTRRNPSGGTMTGTQINGKAFGFGVETLDDLKALSSDRVRTVYLHGRTTPGDGGEGVFRWDSSDLSASVTADPLAGIYVPPDSDPTGASGSWVRQHTVKEVYPEWWGAKGDGSDDTAALEGALTATLGGGIIILSRLYGTTGLELAGLNMRGITLRGNSGLEVKRGDNLTGLRAIADQQYVLKLGSEGAGDTTPIERFRLEHVTLAGMDYQIGKALLWIARASQSEIVGSAFWRAKADPAHPTSSGAAIYANKMEDFSVTRNTFTMLGNGILFGDMPGGDTFASNAIRVYDNRFEFIDAVHIGNDREATDPWASRLRIVLNKFEMGEYTGTTGGAYPFAVTYGDYSPSHCPIDFANVVTTSRTDLQFTNNWVQTGELASVPLFTFGSARSVTVTGNSFGIGSDVDFVLLALQGPAGEAVGARGFVLKDNTMVAASAVSDTRKIRIVNRNTGPIIYEPPLDPLAVGFHTVLKSTRFIPLSAVSNNVNSAALTMVPDPDPETDPCLSVAQAVLSSKVASGSSADLVSLTAPPSGTGLYSVKGINSGAPRFLRIGLRVKVDSGSAKIGVRYIAGSGSKLAQFTTTATTWEWQYLYVNLLGGSVSDLRLNYESTDSGVTFYGDVMTIDWVDQLILAAMPASGAFVAGDFVRKAVPAEVGTAGSKYMVVGWTRITTGTNHVLGTDWLEERVLTGN